MGKFVITTDACSDLSEEYLLENNIMSLPLYYSLNDTVYGEENDMDPHEFYDAMRKGSMPNTMACNPETAKEIFKNIVEKGYDIIHIAFSSALSSSYNSVTIAANEVKEEFPTRRIEVIDSKCASMGQGLLVHKLVQMKEQGKGMDEILGWIDENLMNVCHQFTVDNLYHLHRGGRVSKATAIVGTLINVKPVLHVDDEGRLVSLCNVRGRKKALQTLVDNMEKCCKDYENDVVFISHGDCLEDAQKVADMIKERLGIEKFVINYVGPTIGSHAGPGTVALFFMGSKR